MPSIQIKDVPDDVHAVLRRRAAAAGQSLQEYMLARVTADATSPTVDEVFARIEHHTGGSIGLKTAARLVRADRESR